MHWLQKNNRCRLTRGLVNQVKKYMKTLHDLHKLAFKKLITFGLIKHIPIGAHYCGLLTQLKPHDSTLGCRTT